MSCWYVNWDDCEGCIHFKVDNGHCSISCSNPNKNNRHTCYEKDEFYSELCSLYSIPELDW